MSALITADLIILDENLGETRFDVIEHLAGAVVDAGRATDFETLYAAARARDAPDVGVQHAHGELEHVRPVLVYVDTCQRARDADAHVVRPRRAGTLRHALPPLFDDSQHTDGLRAADTA